RKTHIGPWSLGRTLGCGSTARVRLVKHTSTGDYAAVKILSRSGIPHTQPSSIANLDKWDRTRSEYKLEKRMPINVEREVAIMKLIDHPNIVKLYDIWESRAEIYLVLEFAQKGDLYSYVSQQSYLSEVEAIFFFRQILSALEYVHSFNICHRDLKLENILLTDDNQIKIIDFGMSAIHQGPQHVLTTACGSPHYAAPELIAKKGYRAETVDIWSLGIILYACMTGRLPFDGSNQSEVLSSIEHGLYHLPEFLSDEAQDLISGILVVDPKERLSSRELWQHPLVRMYDHLDHLNDEGAHDFARNTRCDPVPDEELDRDTLRQLKAIWHTFHEGQIAMALTNDEPNEFKMFYWLINSYKEKVLENYGTDLTHSPSDFHHLRATNWKKRYTTIEFPAKHGRNMARFTIISHVATDENGEILETPSINGAATVQSYDPFKSSQVIDDVVASHAKIVVHRNGTTSTRSSAHPPTHASVRTRTGSVKTNSSTHSRPPRSGRRTGTSATLRKSRHSLKSIKSGEEVSYSRPVLRHKRGVDFSLARKRLTVESEVACHPASIAEGDTGHSRNFSYPANSIGRSKTSQRSGRRRSGTQSMAETSQVEDSDLHWNEELRQWSHTIAKDCDDAFNSSLLDDPDGSYLTEAPLQSPITETRETIRLVKTPSLQSNTVKTSANPNVRKNPPLSIWPKTQIQQGLTLHQQYVADESKPQVPNGPSDKTGESLIPVVKKKPSWFRRNSKEKNNLLNNTSLGKTDELERTNTDSSTTTAKVLTKKKSFGFGWLRGSKERPQYKLSLGDYDDCSPERVRTSSQSSRPPYNKNWNDNVATRNVEPQRSWLARLFRVKPATRYLCFSMSRNRVRQEITYLLKEWRCHGMRDIVVDKDRGLVFARVAKKNYLNLREASFAAEIMTVVEHGRRNHLSVVRFTQERGAASTFHKVVDTMDAVFGSRGLLITDKHKAKIMVKMLD
ncbi:Pkinase-domain-containing protein, partial [Hypoxylon sp. EC38]